MSLLKDGVCEAMSRGVLVSKEVKGKFIDVGNQVSRITDPLLEGIHIVRLPPYDTLIDNTNGPPVSFQIRIVRRDTKHERETGFTLREQITSTLTL